MCKKIIIVKEKEVRNQIKPINYYELNQEFKKKIGEK